MNYEYDDDNAAFDILMNGIKAPSKKRFLESSNGNRSTQPLYNYNPVPQPRNPAEFSPRVRANANKYPGPFVAYNGDSSGSDEDSAQKYLPNSHYVDDSPEDDDDDEEEFDFEKPTIRNLNPNSQEAKYYKKWEELIEMERQQKKINEKKELRLKITFLKPDGQDRFIFYQSFQSKKKCNDFKTKISKSKKMKIIPFPGAIKPTKGFDESEFIAHGIEGTVKKKKTEYKGKDAICYLYIASKTLAANQIVPNSEWEIREDQPDFYDQMKGNVAKLCNDAPELFGLVERLQPPVFKNNHSLVQYHPFYKGQLNSNQEEALEKVNLSCRKSLLKYFSV